MEPQPHRRTNSIDSNTPLRFNEQYEMDVYVSEDNIQQLMVRLPQSGLTNRR